MEEKKKGISLEDLENIPYNIVVNKILIHCRVEFETVEVTKFYGYFKRDRSRKLFVLFKSITLRESQFKLIQIIPKRIVNLEIQTIKKIKHKYLDQILNKTNIKSLTIDGKVLMRDKLFIDNFSIFKNLERLSIVRKECYIGGWKDITYNIKYIRLESSWGKALYTFDCKILKNFVKLKTMIMVYINMENFEFLSEVKTLETLYIHNCTISTKETARSCLFYKMPMLKRIFLNAYGIHNIEFLHYNENLTIFKIYSINQIESNLKGISKCKNLERLSILKSIKNTDFLDGVDLPKLVFLNLEGLQISSVERFGNMQSLRALKISRRNTLETIKGINKFKNLRMLNLSYTNISSLEGIDLPMLLYIDLYKTNIKNLLPLSTSKKLVALDATNTKIETIDVELPNLRVLIIKYCHSLYDISGIRRFKKLEILAIFDTPAKFTASLQSSLKELKVVVVDIVSDYQSRGNIFVRAFDMETAIESFEGISNLDFNI